MLKNNEKGFTVIELILSFILVMFLAIAIFALVNNYRNKEQEEAINRDLSTLETTLVQDIYQDILLRKLKKIEYCMDDTNGDGIGDDIIKQCIYIHYLDGVTKQLIIGNEEITTNEAGTTFTYDTFNIIYGNVKYSNPAPKFAKIVSDYILTYTTENDDLEYGTLYKIKIRIKHQDLSDEYVIELVTTCVD